MCEDSGGKVILPEYGGVSGWIKNENVVCPKFTKIGLVRKILTDTLKHS